MPLVALQKLNICKMNLKLTDIPWNRLIGWYNNCGFMLEAFKTLETGSKEDQQKALKKICLETEHQGGIIFVAPFSIYFLKQALQGNSLVKDEILAFLKDVKTIVNDTLNQYKEDENLARLKQDSHSLNTLLQEQYLFEATDDEAIIEDQFAIASEDNEWYTLVYLITQNLLNEL